MTRRRHYLRGLAVALIVGLLGAGIVIFLRHDSVSRGMELGASILAAGCFTVWLTRPSPWFPAM